MITVKVLDEVNRVLAELLNDHRAEMSAVYANHSELSVAITLKLTQGAQPSMIDVKAGISFVVQKIKDDSECTIDTAQLKLFEVNKP